MKQRKIFVIYFSFLLFFIIFTHLISHLEVKNEILDESINKPLYASDIFEGILIDDLTVNNWTWAKEQGYCSGTGTENDPFLFNHHVFQNSSGSGHSIAILNSQKYFKFENCRFLNNVGFAGLYLYNTTNGVFQQNGFWDNSIGILLNNCNDSIFTFLDSNSVYENNHGIILNNSNYINFNYDISVGVPILPLTCSNNKNSGIYLENSHHNNLHKIESFANGISGIFLNNSNCNHIENAYILNNDEDGITIFESFNNTISGCEIEQNLMFGINLYNSSFNNISDNSAVNRNNLAEIALSFSNNNTIIRNLGTSSIYESINGIILINSEHNKLIENDFRTHTYALSLIASSYNHITGNTFSSNNMSGIVIALSSYNTISHNKIERNSLHGLNLDSSLYNDVYSNNILANKESGIMVENSQFNRILKNVINDNNIGINLVSSDDNTLVGNMILNNDKCIEEVDCDNNLIVDNTCIETLDMTFILFLSMLIASIGVNVLLLVLLFRKRIK